MLRTAVPFTCVLSTFAACAPFLSATPAKAQSARKTTTAATPVRDTGRDRWVATDALGRTLPDFAQVGAPRADRWIGMFYFLWLGEHGSAGPYDITKILRQDPDAMQKPDSPLWGGLGVPHHWGESVFGYYRADDPWVLRKHAQMLSDAGVDTVIFDVTNNLTYPRSYHALCKVWSKIRREGGKTPQIAFLCPFGDPVQVVESLYSDMYESGRYSDLWFRWQGKPLIMANPDLIRPERLSTSQRYPGLLQPNATYGQTFTAKAPFTAVGGAFPTYASKTSQMTLSLYDGIKPGGKLRLRKTFPNLRDNETVLLETQDALPPGAYYLEMSRSVGQVGWWSESGDRYTEGTAWEDGERVAGDRSLFLRSVGAAEAVAQLTPGNGMTPEQARERAEKIRAFFTFRNPQPDYFAGQTAPNQWGWLEVYPQKPFGKTPDGRPEQLTVGVAQNAVDGKLGVLSNPRGYGRSFHDGSEPPPDKQDYTGRNFAEQWNCALKLDPSFIFVTGWNEWIAGRFDATAPFYGAGPVNFVDQFNHEYSRDIEPVVGGHTDNYYYQFVSAVRRYKGVRAPLPPAAPLAESITIDGRFADWATVGTRSGTTYTDDVFDTTPRDHPAWSPTIGKYTNRTGQNDIVTLKVTHDARNVYFYARTHELLRAPNAQGAMVLTVKANDRVVTLDGKNRLPAGVKRIARGSEVEIVVPRALLGLTAGRAVAMTFKWRDNTDDARDPLNLYRNGDTAPNGRFEYVYRGAEKIR